MNNKSKENKKKKMKGREMSECVNREALKQK